MLFDKSAEGLVAAIYYAGARHRVIANNITNVDTPNYKALDISFKQQLQDFMNMVESRQFKTPHSEYNPSMPQFIPMPPPIMVVSPDLYSMNPRIDRNTVNIDLEMIKLSQNSILHNAFLQVLNNKFRILKTAISGNI